MEMLNIPPAQPQASPTATAKGNAGKETAPRFKEALDSAGKIQSKESAKETAKAQGKTTEATAEDQASSQVDIAQGTEQQLEALTADGNEIKGLLEKQAEASEAAMADMPNPVLAGELLAAQDRSSIDVRTQEQQVGANTVANHPLPNQPLPNAQNPSAANLAEAGTSDGESATASRAAAATAEATATAEQAPAGLKTGPATPASAPAVGLREGNPVAEAHRQSTPQPIAITTVMPTGVPQGLQRKTEEAGEVRQPSGLMESSLGSLLQDVRPLRGELRGQTVADGNRNPVSPLASMVDGTNPTTATAQSEDTLSAFSFEQKADTMLDALGEKTPGSASVDTASFDTALKSGLHTVQTSREGAHPLSAGVAEAGTIRLNSGELLSENQVVDQVLQRIHLEGGNEQSRIVIKMHPEELGEVKLALTLEKDQLRAQLLTQSQQVQEVLEKHLPRLHEALSHQGVRLEDIQVSVDSNRNSGREFFEQHRQADSFRRHLNAPANGVVDERTVAAGASARRSMAEGLSLRV